MPPVNASGLAQINHHISGYLPGNGDNSVFNLMRLHPGILAAGEQPNDIIMWGSPEGTGRVLFDGFTIWGLKNFNDNISAINPYLAQSIEVRKGGYDVTNTDVIGGIIDIAGKTGNSRKKGLNLFINNQTLNTMVELPIRKKSSLILAFRKTYYNLINTNDLNLNKRITEEDILVSPDYQFRDMNMKYTLKGNNGDMFFISMLKSNDDFDIRAEKEYDRSFFNEIRTEHNQQKGGSIFYGKTFKNGYATNIKFSYSSLESNYNNQRIITRKISSEQIIRKNEQALNNISEFSALWNNEFKWSPRNNFSVGVEFIQNHLTLTEDTFNYRYIDYANKANRINFYLQNKISISAKTYLTPGIRYNHSPYLNKFYFNPRLSITHQFSDLFKGHAAISKHHQFLAKSTLVDSDGNYRYSYTLASNKDNPVLESTHRVSGLSFNKNKLLFSVEGFLKHNSNISRQIRIQKENTISIGKSRSYGYDIYLKKDIQTHSFWASYTWSKTEELFPYFKEQEYRRAPQDQRHEIKTAGILNLKPFYFSLSYIYGSGFPLYESFKRNIYSEPDYNRIDISLIYKAQLKKALLETGLTIQNLTNANNIKYTQFEKVPLEQLNTVYINTNAVPFTPLLYLKLKL
jgi:hypothetical protein